MNRPGGMVLRDSELGFLRRMPPDGGGVEENGGSQERREPRPFGIPLVPADERPQPASRSVERLEAEVSGSEIKLFVIERIVGDVHLAVETARRSIGVEEGSGVVIDARGTLLKQRRY